MYVRKAACQCPPTRGQGLLFYFYFCFYFFGGIVELKALANERDVPYQALLKVFLADACSLFL